MYVPSHCALLTCAISYHITDSFNFSVRKQFLCGDVCDISNWTQNEESVLLYLILHMWNSSFLLAYLSMCWNSDFGY